MVGDYWLSDKTGRIYEVGAPGTEWSVVGHRDDLAGPSGLLALLGLLGAGLGLGVGIGLFVAVCAGLLLGAVLVTLPDAVPFSVPLSLIAVVVVGVRSIVTRRPLGPALRAGGVFIILLTVVAVHVLLWRREVDFYDTLGSVPLMVVLTLGLAVFAAGRKRRTLAAFFGAQSVVFASSYLGATGNVTFAMSATGYDNLLALAFWACIACTTAAWLTPRKALELTVWER